MRSSVAELLLFPPMSPPAVKVKLVDAGWDWIWSPLVAALMNDTILFEANNDINSGIIKI